MGRGNYPGAKISPELEPTSHNKFFDHDYPDDSRAPKPVHDFQHPYPILQDSEDYDKDYVKDENSDGGEWKVQETYDTLRGKLARQQALLKAASGRDEALRNKVAEAKMEEENARHAMDKAKAAEGAKKSEADAKRTAAGKSSVNDLGSHVEAEVSTLQACNKRLEDARTRLKALQDEKQKAEYELKEATAAKEADEQEHAAKEKEDIALQAEVKDLTVAHHEALEKYQEQDATLTKMEMGLKDARSNLHMLRHMFQVDRKGGVYYNGMGVTTSTTPTQPPPSEPLHKRIWPRPSAAPPRAGLWLAAAAAALAVTVEIM
jgi:hypothetical protein